MAAIGEREDINAHGINSDQAISWLVTQAQVADLCGNHDQAARLRATVTRMGKDTKWWERQAAASDTAEPVWHSAPQPPPPTPSPPARGGGGEPARRRRRTWPYVAVIAALALATAGVWQNADDDHQRQERQEKAAKYKGRSGAALDIDGVKADVVAHWNSNRDHVIVELRTYADQNAKFLRIDTTSGQSAQTKRDTWFPKAPQISVPVRDPLADVTVRAAVGGKGWHEGAQPSTRTVRLSPTGIAYDAETGQSLPSDL
ncbi:hypothetical protein [Streptomyces sp. NPDC053048]|uniref:hypothetical protein n=1 Tax=Streptomyces sp. NPDC053048 TaxID=3365694 RepID=UPI0037D25656